MGETISGPVDEDVNKERLFPKYELVYVHLFYVNIQSREPKIKISAACLKFKWTPATRTSQFPLWGLRFGFSLKAPRRRQLEAHACQTRPALFLSTRVTAPQTPTHANVSLAKVNGATFSRTH